MTRPRTAAWIAALMALGTARSAVAQEFAIGVIDFYGLRRVSVQDARRALTFAEGDTLSLASDEQPAPLVESERRLAALAGVSRARTNIVCCDEGRLIIYVGIEEKGEAAMLFRATPTGAIRLHSDVAEAGYDFDVALTAAVERGDATEDDSQGHALFHDPATRAVQERFVRFAAKDANMLRRVLRECAVADERALAAQILGYVANKQTVVEDLVDAMSDPSEKVRNNAMRALVVFTRMTPPRAPPSIPYEPFIELLRSLVWTDRNKASLALMELTESRDAALLATLRNDAIEPLVQMARWKNEGHAMPALTILGRIAGWPDDDTRAAWSRGQREKVVAAALASQ